MRELFAFYWFCVKVVASLLWLLFLSSTYRLKKYKSVLAFVLLILLLILIYVAQQSQVQQLPVPVSRPPAYAPYTEIESLSPDEVQTKITKQEQLLKLQPTHVDTLINLGLLHESLGQTDQATKYWQQAYMLDPYHYFFTYLEENRYK